MKTKRISGVTYFTYPNGIMVPLEIVREAPTKIRLPSDFLPRLFDLAVAEVEHVVVFTLDGNNQIIKRHDVNKGVANSCTMHPREVYRPAYIDGAVSIMVVHNHPSGNLEPSDNDLAATKRLTEVSRTMGISLLDHMIVAGRLSESGNVRYTSLREKYPNYF